MQVLDLAKLPKQLLQVLLAGLLVDVRHQHDPPFDAAHRDRARGRADLGRRLGLVGGRGWGGGVDVHFCGGHCFVGGDGVGEEWVEVSVGGRDGGEFMRIQRS